MGTGSPILVAGPVRNAISNSKSNNLLVVNEGTLAENVVLNGK